MQPPAGMRTTNLAAIVIVTASACLAAPLPKPQTFSLTGSEGLIARGVEIRPVEYQGRKAIQLTKDPKDEGGLAILKGLDFQDGTIEVDLAMKPTVPPGVRMPGFIGIAFRLREDASHFELFYVRPGNSHAPEQPMRNHSVQYTSEPQFGWHYLRRDWPETYEAHADLMPETWTKLKIEVSGRTARLYLNGASSPSLVVDGLKGEDLRGGIGLWGYAGQESYFSNLRITPSEPAKIQNGADVAGKWDLNYVSDTGRFQGSLALQRNDGKVSGTWSGSFGADLPVTGTWRNGYVELSFSGAWPEGTPYPSGGPVPVKLAGWIDGDAGKGRMRVEGRADGSWTAIRKP